MCVPAVALTIAAGALSAGGAIVGGINANNAAQYQASVYQANAALDRKAAQDALARGAQQEQQQYVKTAQLIGQQRASMAANGLDVDFGSAAQVQQDSAQIGAQDANIIRENATREANGYEINAFNDTAQAASAKQKSAAAMEGAIFGAGGTILSTASQVNKLKAGSASYGSSDGFASRFDG